MKPPKSITKAEEENNVKALDDLLNQGGKMGFASIAVAYIEQAARRTAPSRFKARLAEAVQAAKGNDNGNQ